MHKIRVLVVDDSDEFHLRISAWLESFGESELVGTARNGREAIEQVARLDPDLVLMDVRMPDMNGFDATRRIKSKPGAPPVILLTFYESRAARAKAWAVGADAFVPKAKLTKELMRVIRELFPESTDRASAKASLSSLRRSGPPRDLTP